VYIVSFLKVVVHADFFWNKFLRRLKLYLKM